MSTRRLDSFTRNLRSTRRVWRRGFVCLGLALKSIAISILNSKRIIDACKASDEVDVIRRANGEIGPDCAYVVRVRNGASQAIEIDEALADDLFAAEENLDTDDLRFEGDGEEIEDEDEDEDCEDGGEEDDDDDAGGSNGGGPGNNAGGNNAGGPGKSGK